jgi:hypothetical protein
MSKHNDRSLSYGTGSWQQPLAKAYKSPGVAEHEMFVQPVEGHLFHPNTDPEIKQMAQGALVHKNHSKQQVRDVDEINRDSSFKVGTLPLYAKHSGAWQNPMAEFVVPELAHKLGLGENFQARAGFVNLKHNQSGTVLEPHEERTPQGTQSPNVARTLTLSKWIPMQHLGDLRGTGEHDPKRMKIAYKETLPNLNKLFIFDNIIQNSDRHEYNYGIDKNGRIQMIDHGLAMKDESPSYVMPTYLSDMSYDWTEPVDRSALDWLKSINPEEVHSFIMSHDHDLLSAEDKKKLKVMADNTKRRLVKLQDIAETPRVLFGDFRW